MAEGMALSREHHHVETLVGVDERVGHADGVAGMDVVVDVAMHEHQMSL